MTTKSILMSLGLLMSLSAQAFDKSTAYIDSAELFFKDEVSTSSDETVPLYFRTF